VTTHDSTVPDTRVTPSSPEGPVDPASLIQIAPAFEHLRSWLGDTERFVTKLPPGGSHAPPMVINFEEGFEPKRLGPQRRFSPAVEAAIATEIQAQLDLGIIEECSDTPRQEVVMIKKPDSPSGYRFCLDSRATNVGTKIDRYDTPNIRDIFTEVAGAKYFCRFDMISSYWQFMLAEESRSKTAFRANNRCYRYKVCPMGNVQSSFHVQRHMTSMLGNLIGNGAIVYIDDIILYASSVEEMEARIKEMMERLAEWNFFLKAPKCVIGMPELTILGHVLSRDGRRMANDRIAQVSNLEYPRTPKQLRSALGETNFMRDYIPDYSNIVKPLTSIVNGTAKDLRSIEAMKAW